MVATVRTHHEPGKTEMCLFYKRDICPIIVKLGSENITTKSQMNVLGVIFYSKLNWAPQVSNAIKKGNKTLTAIKLISKYFNVIELSKIITVY